MGVFALTAVAALLGGCGQAQSPVATTSTAAPTTGSVDPHGQLTARTAAAKDRRFIAGYTLSRPDRRGQAVAVTVATDGTWRVDVQGGAYSGSTDIALVGRQDGQYQCALNSVAVGTGCVRVATAGRKLPSSIDPQVQYPFTDWLDILTDPTVAVAVTVTSITNVPGICYAVEPTTVTLSPPIQSAVLCYADDGTLTGVRSSFGTLVLSGQPTAPPATVPLPGAIVSRAPLPTAGALPQPTTSAPGSTAAAPPTGASSPSPKRTS
jgi:hypothetical protein